MRFLLATVIGLLLSTSLEAGVLRKRSGQAIIMSLSRSELETVQVGREILIEDFEGNQWRGLLRRIYRVNLAKITLIEDDSDEMEVGEVFRIKPLENASTLQKTIEDDVAEVILPQPPQVPIVEPAKGGEPTGQLLPVQDGAKKTEVKTPTLMGYNIYGGITRRWYVAKGDSREGNLVGMGPLVGFRATWPIGIGLGFQLRQEELTYAGLDEFSAYTASLLSTSAEAFYSRNFSQWQLAAGLSTVFYTSGEGELKDTFVLPDMRPGNIAIRGRGEIWSSEVLVSVSYPLSKIFVQLEGSYSFESVQKTRYRQQLSAPDGTGNIIIQESRYQSRSALQTSGLSLGIGAKF